MHALTLALVVVAAGLEIDDGVSDRPSGAAVAEALRGVAADADAAVRERVELRRQDGALHLRLLDLAGATLAERSLPGNDCGELARTSAVLLAAWRTEVAASAPKLELTRPAPRRARDLSYEVAASFLGSLAGSSFAAGAEVATALGRRCGRVLARLGVFGLDLRPLSVGTNKIGHARFTRAGLSAGPLVRFRPGRWLFDLHAETTAAILYLDAVGFATNQRSLDFDLGLGGGARAAIHARAVAPFLGVSVAGWLTGPLVRVSGPTGGTAAVPRFEVFLEAGIAFGND